MIKNVLLTALLLASFLLWRWYDGKEEELWVAPVDPTQPEFIAHSLYSVSFDEKGKLSYRIYADSMAHHEQQNRTVFKQPTILVYPKEIRPVWQLSAHSGVLIGTRNQTQTQDDKALNESKGFKVVLNDDVKINNLTNNEYVKQISTSEIELDLDSQTIHTQAKVFIEGPQYDLQGVGLVGNLSDERVSLLEKVHGLYHQ